METHPHCRDLPCVGLIRVLFGSCLWHSEQLKTTHSQFLSDCFSLNTLIEHRCQSSKHGKSSHNKTSQTIATRDNRRPNIRKSIETCFSCRRDLRFPTNEVDKLKNCRKQTDSYAQCLSVSLLLTHRPQTTKRPCSQVLPDWLA